MHDSKWTPIEKRIARAAYEKARERQLGAVIDQTKRRQSDIRAPGSLGPRALADRTTQRH